MHSALEVRLPQKAPALRRVFSSENRFRDALVIYVVYRLAGSFYARATVSLIIPASLVNKVND